MADPLKISVRLAPELHALLLARVGQGERVSDVIRTALEAYLGLTRPTDRPTTTPVSDTLSDTVVVLSDSVEVLTRQMADVQARLAQLSGQESAPLPPVRPRPTMRPTPQQQPGPAVAPHIAHIADFAATYDKLSLAELAQLLYDRGIYRARDRHTGEAKPVNRGTLQKWLEQARTAGLL